MEKRKQYGQYFTLKYIAEFMAGLVLTGRTKTVLDPAVGPGVFEEVILSANADVSLDGYEIDPLMLKEYRINIKAETKIFEQDYLQSGISKKYDAIICNPPYNRFQEIAGRQELKERFLKEYGIRMSGYSNYCVYFLIKSLNELAEDGRCAYIIPYEFLNTGYGTAVKEYLLKTGRLKAIIKFDNRLKLFEDAVTTTCILFFDGVNNEKVYFLEAAKKEELKTLGEWLNPQPESDEIGGGSRAGVGRAFAYSKLEPSAKWLTYFKKEKAPKEHTVTIHLGEIGKVKRGIATGRNAFFGLNAETIARLGLSRQACLKCINKAPDVDCLILTKERFEEYARRNKKVYLFDGFRAKSKADFDYIRYGERSGVNEVYLTKKRNPWYKAEEKEPAPILFSVFSRKRIKVVRNEAMVRTLTAFHGFYPNTQDEDEINVLFCYLLTPTAQRLLFENKREYGEGLDKFEPGDLNQAEVLDLNKLTAIDKREVLQLYEEIKKCEADYVCTAKSETDIEEDCVKRKTDDNTEKACRKRMGRRKENAMAAELVEKLDVIFSRYSSFSR